MIATILAKAMTIASVILALLIQTMLESFMRWFTPDLFFLVLLVQTLILRRLDFASLFFVCLFYDIFTDNVFGATVLTLAIVLYFIELTGFSYVRHSFFASSGVIALFYCIYLAVQQIINFGVEELMDPGSLYLLFSVLSTVLVWMLGWKLQAAKH